VFTTRFASFDMPQKSGQKTEQEFRDWVNVKNLAVSPSGFPLASAGSKPTKENRVRRMK
jgi:hypothetical protein